MVIRVVEFSSGGYKIRKISAKKSKYPKGLRSGVIGIFLNSFFIEEYQFRSTFFVIDIFDNINF